MPDNIDVTLTAGSLPEGYCYPASPQQFLNDIVAVILAQIPGSFSLFNFGPNTPPVDQQNLPWLRTDNTGIIDGWYTFSGAWVRPYPVPASSSERRLWMGTEDDLKTYDGGSIDSITDRTGPFWVVDHDFDFRVPLGPGTSSPAGTVVAVGDTGGNEKVTLDAATVPDHTHLVPFFVSDSAVLVPHPWDATGPHTAVPGTVRSVQGTDFPFNDCYQLQTGPSGGGGPQTALDLMNPYKGAFVIKRTARSLIVAP